MKIGVISDTHGHLGNTASAVQVLLQRNIKTVLHCGDIGSPEVVELLVGFDAHFVFGNCDSNREGLRFTIRQLGLTCHDEFGDFRLAGRRIALIHSHDAVKFRQVKTSGHYDLICYGHTHAAESHTEGRSLILNPGALYRAAQHTIAVVELETMQIESVDVN